MDASPCPSKEDLRRIMELVGASLAVTTDPGRLELEYHEVIESRQEVRLRFNAPTPVVAWTLRLVVSSPGGGKLSGEIELFHWLADDEWEIWHSSLA